MTQQENIHIMNRIDQNRKDVKMFIIETVEPFCITYIINYYA